MPLTQNNVYVCYGNQFLKTANNLKATLKKTINVGSNLRISADYSYVFCCDQLGSVK